MSIDHSKMGIVSSTKLDKSPQDLEMLENIFGTKKPAKTNGAPDVHFIMNEKRQGPDPHKRDPDEYPDHTSQPLLEPDKDTPKPPLASPDIDFIDGATPALPFPGIHDGLFEPIDKPHDPDKEDHSQDEGSHETADEAGTGEDGNLWLSNDGDQTDYPYGNELTLDSRFGERPVSVLDGPNVNSYQQKKNLAQGMMDLALLSANANQLRYVVEASTSHPYYLFSLIFISLSIILQVLVGIGLILNSQYDVTDDKEIHKAVKVNNMTVIGIFLVTIVNVFITAFSVATPTK